MSEVVAHQDAVLMHLELKLKDGSLAETTRAGKPSKFQLGDGSLSPAIEEQLLGLKVGDKKQFEVSAEDGFGLRQQGMIQHLERHLFPSDMDVSIGSIIAFAHPSGGEMPGVVTAIEGQSITVDFNHPLAGHDLQFVVEVVAINP